MYLSGRSIIIANMMRHSWLLILFRISAYIVKLRYNELGNKEQNLWCQVITMKIGWSRAVLYGRVWKNDIRQNYKSNFIYEKYSDVKLFIIFYYSEFQGFRSWVARWLFSSRLWPLLKQVSFFEATGKVSKIGSGLKSNHHWQI